MKKLVYFLSTKAEFSYEWKPSKFSFFKGLTVIGKAISGKQISTIIKKAERNLCDFCGILPKENDSNYCRACKHENLS